MTEFPFQPQDPVVSGSGSLPDANTAEAILFGPSYTWIKSALWVWDEMEDYLLRKADSLDSQIMDREWAYDVMRHNRYLIYARSPPVNEVSHLKDLFTLRSLCKCIAGIRKIDEYRKQNMAWARMKGIDQYVKSMAGRGISESEWKAATASYNMEPITYDYVHGLTPSMMPGEYIDWNEAMVDLMGEKDYQRLIAKLTGCSGFDDQEDSEDLYEESFDVSTDVRTEVTEDSSEDIYESDDEGSDNDSDDPFWVGFEEAVAVMFSDPISYASETAVEEDDECSVVADYWSRLDIDDRSIIDALIGFAEAMT